MVLSTPLRVSAALLVAASAAWGFPELIAKIPNGASVMANGASWPAVGHSTASGSGSLNAFGHAFDEISHCHWTKSLCHADSDGDGQINGLELGDPYCTWTPGSTPTSTLDISHPGIKTSTTATTEATVDVPQDSTRRRSDSSDVDDDDDDHDDDVMVSSTLAQSMESRRRSVSPAMVSTTPAQSTESSRSASPATESSKRRSASPTVVSSEHAQRTIGLPSLIAAPARLTACF
mmetsp:Transcript_18543/g.51699  ORF Transcript_18543/g.51699 Transcript_18543/m.51699 type:complete len:234 (+) Transcript_18543:53-754(+)